MRLVLLNVSFYLGELFLHRECLLFACQAPGFDFRQTSNGLSFGDQHCLHQRTRGEG
jgi:hypothetical protein